MAALDRQAELERIGAERLAAEHEMEGDARRALLWCLLGCVASCLGGLFLLGLAVHVTDAQLGWIYFWSGLNLGHGGICYSLFSYYRGGEERGDW